MEGYSEGRAAECQEFVTCFSVDEELREAEQEIVRETFPEESSSLQKGQNVKRTNHIYKRNLVLEVLSQ